MENMMHDDSGAHEIDAGTQFIDQLVGGIDGWGGLSLEGVRI